MASTKAIVPVTLGGRYQQGTATVITPVATSDTVPVGPCAQIIVGGAGNLVLGMWDGTTRTIPVVAGEVIFVSPKLIKVATTATNLFTGY